MRRAIVGLLVLATCLSAVAGIVLAELDEGSVAGIATLGVAVVSAVLAWVALGAPIRRRDIRRPDTSGAL